MYGGNYDRGYSGRRNNGYERGGNRNRWDDRGSSRRGYGDRMEPVREENPAVEFTKNFYTPTKTHSNEEINGMRSKWNMKLIGSDIPAPVNDFNSLGFPEEVIKHFASKNYTVPTGIQAQGWPMALSGRDMVGIADTGSGKTISFVLPALIHAKAQVPLRERDGPIVLILAPTRELCNQIETVVSEYAGFFGLRSTAIYGGVSMVPQKRALSSGVEVLVATPGRLQDLNSQGFCPLNRVTFLVLDEADRMLDMGFEPQLQNIIPKTNPERQTLMWSATWPREVKTLASNFMKDFIQVTIGSDELQANAKIQQDVDVVSSRSKMDKLCAKLEEFKDQKVIIFTNTKRMCDMLEDDLYRKNFKAAAIHGDKSQLARDTIFNNFKSGRNNILIATDVAARGLDVNDVKLVINYDFPKSIDDYVHRIGRTARGDVKEGHAYTMLTKDDSGVARKLSNLMRQAGQKIPQALSDMISSGSSRYSQGSRDSRGGYRDRRFGY